MGKKMNACRILAGKPEGKRPLGRQRRRWINYIKMNFREIGCCGTTRLMWLRIGISGGLL
jgi:hypothetical protein